MMKTTGWLAEKPGTMADAADDDGGWLHPRGVPAMARCMHGKRREDRWGAETLAEHWQPTLLL